MLLMDVQVVVRAQEMLRTTNVRADKQWPGACGPPDFCNSDFVVFPSSSTGSTITEDYFVNIEYGASEQVYSTFSSLFITLSYLPVSFFNKTRMSIPLVNREAILQGFILKGEHWMIFLIKEPKLLRLKGINHCPCILFQYLLTFHYYNHNSEQLVQVGK